MAEDELEQHRGAATPAPPPPPEKGRGSRRYGTSRPAAARASGELILAALMSAMGGERARKRSQFQEKKQRHGNCEEERHPGRELCDRRFPAARSGSMPFAYPIDLQVTGCRRIELRYSSKPVRRILPVPHLRVRGRFTRHLPIISATMGTDNPLEALGTLPEEVLAEVVREGELKLQAQLEASLAGDIRALSLAGFSLTGSTALLGAAAALARNERPDYSVMLIATALGALLLVSGGLAVLSARPVRFHFPGNEPKNWLPSEWQLSPSEKPTLKRARVEQAIVLQSLIGKNQQSCERNARLTTAALALIFIAGALAAFSFAALLVARSW